MASPKEVFKLVVKPDIAKSDKDVIGELIARVFNTRSLIHFAHWHTKSFSQHMALGDLYDSIVEDIDEIVEVYQGKFGLIEDLHTEGATLPKDICKHVKDEADWVENNRMFISKGETSIENLIDTLVGHMHKAVYKLENLS